MTNEDINYVRGYDNKREYDIELQAENREDRVEEGEKLERINAHAY